MTSREPKTLRAILANRTMRAVGFGVGFGLTMGAATVVYAEAFDGITDMGGQTRETPASVADDHVRNHDHPSRVERLMERHSCWSGEGPPGVIPGRAIVSAPGGRAEVVPADVGFGIWLDGEPGSLHAFCR
jgi:hypothetical protein